MRKEGAVAGVEYALRWYPKCLYQMFRLFVVAYGCKDLSGLVLFISLLGMTNLSPDRSAYLNGCQAYPTASRLDEDTLTSREFRVVTSRTT